MIELTLLCVYAKIYKGYRIVKSCPQIASFKSFQGNFGAIQGRRAIYCNKKNS